MDLAEPDYWQVVSRHFDGMLAQQWQRAQAAHVSRADFLRGNRESLSLFFEYGDRHSY